MHSLQVNRQNMGWLQLPSCYPIPCCIVIWVVKLMDHNREEVCLITGNFITSIDYPGIMIIPATSSSAIIIFAIIIIQLSVSWYLTCSLVEAAAREHTHSHTITDRGNQFPLQSCRLLNVNGQQFDAKQEKSRNHVHNSSRNKQLSYQWQPLHDHKNQMMMTRNLQFDSTAELRENNSKAIHCILLV